MSPFARILALAPSLLLSTLLLSAPLFAEGDTPDPGVGPDPATREAAIQEHVRTLETSPTRTLEEIVEALESRHLAPILLDESDRSSRRESIREIRDAAARAEAVLVEPRGEHLALSLHHPDGVTEVVFAVEAESPFRITRLEVIERSRESPTIRLDAEDPEALFEELEQAGLAGAASVTLDGERRFLGGFGTANEALGAPVGVETAFGIGSTPIDFTLAAIALLEEHGLLSRGDPISRFVDDVPANKKDLTIEHLSTGRSGLPDFFHEAGDRDPDLAWIERSEAERRILDAELLFAPGTAVAHSHAAFVHLAAVVERVSGTTYPVFVREEILEPAGMTRTGWYGDAGGLGLADFAVGGGPSLVGLPNIPPNWGPTSWLVQGSGGMYSTLEDLLRFHSWRRSRKAGSPAAGRTIAGSDRGYFVFHAFDGPDDEILLLLAADARSPLVQETTRILASWVDRSGR